MNKKYKHNENMSPFSLIELTCPGFVLALRRGFKILIISRVSQIVITFKFQ